MLDVFATYADQYGLTAEMLPLTGLAAGAMLAFWGVSSAMARRNPAADRLASIAASRREARLDRGLLKAPEVTPGKIMKAFVPADNVKRSELQSKLAQAGFARPEALLHFTLVRIFLGLVLPGLLLALIVASRTPGIDLPAAVTERLGGLTNLGTLQLLSVLIALGYFGPAYWLDGRVKERRQRIEESFPNALDLMQISVESGMGFDAAMTRVGNELMHTSPDIAFEFLSVQRQIQAGRPREAAMFDMAQRTGVETVRSFANVAKQSMQFGTNMSSALTTYAHELRNYREMRAQEMANKLPVKMSAVLASLMLPVLIMLTVGPVVIRYARMMGG